MYKHLTTLLILLACACSPVQEPYLYKCLDEGRYSSYKEQSSPYKPILIRDSYSSDIKKAMRLIEEERLTEAGQMVRSMTDENERNFLTGLMYVREEKYSAALQLFNRLPDKAFDYQSGILKLDCDLETRETSVNNEEFKTAYQNLYDLTDDPVIREIIRQRFRYLIYVR